MDQLRSVVKASLACLDKAHAACKEPALLKMTFNICGQDKVVATVSTQPRPMKRQRRNARGELLGGFSAHLLYKRPETGAVGCFRRLLESDKELLSAVQAVHGTSKSGAIIANVAFLAESLADKAWGNLTPADKQPWITAAERAKGHLEAVRWGSLDHAIERCDGFSKFFDELKALKPAPSAVPSPPPHARDDLDDL